MRGWGAGSDPATFFDTLCAGVEVSDHRVRDFEPSSYFEAKELRRSDRFAQLAVASALEAIGDAGELDADPERSGIVFGAGIGGISTLQREVGTLIDKGPRRVSPFLVPMVMGNAGAAAISMRLGWHGPCETIVTACAAGTQAIGNAYRLVAHGRLDLAVAGGAEAAMEPAGEQPAIGVVALSNMTAMSASGCSRPFDRRRDGFVLAEGAAALVLEDLDHAVARGAHIYAEILGAASTADAYHMTAPAPGGTGAYSCMVLAIEDAGITPEDVTHVNAHATSTPAGDLAEAQAIERLFGPASPPVSSMKGVTGHALAASGAIEAVAVALSVERRLIPPTAGLECPDPDVHLDVVTTTPRALPPGPVLSNSFGFAGHNGCLVLGSLQMGAVRQPRMTNPDQPAPSVVPSPR